ncbi:MAG: hypothetical protein WB783_05210 [Arenicellales bacterium]
MVAAGILGNREPGLNSIQSEGYRQVEETRGAATACNQSPRQR